MEPKNYVAGIEAILFVATEPVKPAIWPRRSKRTKRPSWRSWKRSRNARRERRRIRAGADRGWMALCDARRARLGAEEVFREEGGEPSLARGTRDARDHRVSAAGDGAGDFRHPRRELHRRHSHAARTADDSRRGKKERRRRAVPLSHDAKTSWCTSDSTTFAICRGSKSSAI